MTWEELKASFATNVESSYNKTYTWLEQAMARAPNEVKRRVAASLSALKIAGRNLSRARALLPNSPRTKAEADLIVRYAEMKSLYDAILSGIGINAVQLDAEKEVEAGFVPVAVVVTIGALGLTAVGVAWAIANHEYAAALRDQAGFLAKELEARQESMRTGKELPASSGYAQDQADTNKDKKPDDKKGGWGWVWALLGLGAVAGASVVLPKLAKR